MRRVVQLAVAMALLLALVAGVAYAATLEGGPGNTTRSRAPTDRTRSLAGAETTPSSAWGAPTPSSAIQAMTSCTVGRDRMR